jgi:hypothetical protein
VSGVTGVAYRLESPRRTSVKKSIVLQTGAVDVLGASVVELDALAIARYLLSAKYTAQAHANSGQQSCPKNIQKQT